MPVTPQIDEYALVRFLKADTEIRLRDLEKVASYCVLACFDRKLKDREFFERVLEVSMRITILCHDLRTYVALQSYFKSKEASGEHFGKEIDATLTHLRRLKQQLLADMDVLSQMPYANDSIH